VTRCNVLLTGATGFVGRAIVEELILQKYNIRIALRNICTYVPRGVVPIKVGDMLIDTNWQNALCGVDVVIHAAARVHVLTDMAVDSLAEFRRINVEGTLNLARQAVSAGVKRFVFISSIKVNGESTAHGRPYTTADEPSPVDFYGVSKYEAELGLLDIAAKSGIEVVIIRPVLVYGPGVKANFLSMMRWLNKRAPLPFGAIDNKRSLVALDNLVDLIVTCIDHPAAANESFLVSDDEDLSTTELLQRMAVALGRPTRLLPVPTGLLKAVAVFLGKRDVAQRLLGSLQVDISKTKETLGWTPPVSVDVALKKTAEDFLSRQQY